MFEPFSHSFSCRSVDLMCTTEVREESKPETLVKTTERARVSGSEKHTDVEKQKQNRKNVLERKEKTFLWHCTAPLDTSCQREEYMIDHMSFISAQFIPPR